MELDGRQTLILAILALFLGKFLTGRLRVLRSYSIPAPVTGGVLFSIAQALVYAASGFDVDFDLANRDVLLVAFFSTIGLNSRFGMLLAGGRPLLILILCAAAFLVLQNLAGVAVASLFGASPLAGIVGGSVSLSGGHGTAIAWAPVFEQQLQLENAKLMGLAVATFGLVIGGIVGGPISQFLIARHGLAPSEEDTDEYLVGLPDEAAEGAADGEAFQSIDVDSVLSCLLVMALAIGLGQTLSAYVTALGVKLPEFVGALLVGILLTNLVPPLVPKLSWPAESKALALIADLSLGLFLAMSLMSLELWSILELAAPLLVLLGVQLLTIGVWVVYVVFPLMGRGYDAAVMAGGYAGLGLGATPTAVANMTAVTKRFGPSPLAFLIVPLVGAFFIDVANSVIIKFFIARLG